MQRAHKLGAYFGYSTRLEHWSAVGKTLGNVPDIKIQVDYNTTRIAAVHGLLHSELRLNRGLRAYELQFNPGWAFKADDWQAVAEFEACSTAPRSRAPWRSGRRGFNGAYTPLIKTLALTKLRADVVYVIDMPNVKISPHVPRLAIKVEDLTDMGQTARVRATWRARGGGAAIRRRSSLGHQSTWQPHVRTVFLVPNPGRSVATRAIIFFHFDYFRFMELLEGHAMFAGSHFVSQILEIGCNLVISSACCNDPRSSSGFRQRANAVLIATRRRLSRASQCVHH